MSPARPSPPLHPHSNYPPITIILTVVLLIVFFVGFFSIYFCRCFKHNIFPWNTRQSPTGTPVAASGGGGVGSGLDPIIVQSFPTFTYSTVKEFRKEKYGLECAICLIEFDGGDVLRLLTACCHVFHQVCIDAWLESHKTCPVCRQNLEPESHSPTAQSPVGEQSIGDVSITIRDDSREERTTDGDKGQSSSTGSDSRSCRMEKFSRSHSTGHSIVTSSNEDRFTLRLPEHVKSHIMRGHNCSKSWDSFGDFNRTNRTDGRTSRFADPTREQINR